MQLFQCRVTTSVWLVSLIPSILTLILVYPIYEMQPVWSIYDIFYSCFARLQAGSLTFQQRVSESWCLLICQGTEPFVYLVFICVLVCSAQLSLLLFCGSVIKWLYCIFNWQALITVCHVWSTGNQHWRPVWVFVYVQFNAGIGWGFENSSFLVHSNRFAEHTHVF